jgi:hypothetical protein
MMACKLGVTESESLSHALSLDSEPSEPGSAARSQRRLTEPTIRVSGPAGRPAGRCDSESESSHCQDGGEKGRGGGTFDLASGHIIVF